MLEITDARSIKYCKTMLDQLVFTTHCNNLICCAKRGAQSKGVEHIAQAPVPQVRNAKHASAQTMLHNKDTQPLTAIQPTF